MHWSIPGYWTGQVVELGGGIIGGIIARKEGEPGNEATHTRIRLSFIIQ